MGSKLANRRVQLKLSLSHPLPRTGRVNTTILTGAAGEIATGMKWSPLPP